MTQYSLPPNAEGPPDPPQCIRRSIDNRHSIKADKDQVVVWLSVRRPEIGSVIVNASANGPSEGALAVSVLLDGNPIAHSEESRGLKIIYAQDTASLHLIPGRQYKISGKATVSQTKRLDLLNVYVSVGKGCA